MAHVILSEPGKMQSSFLSQNGGYNAQYLYANKALQPVMLSGFWDNLIDGFGDIGSGIVNIGTNIVDAAGNIIQGAGQGVGGYVSNPNNIAQIGGAVASGLTGMPIGLTNQQQTQYQQQTQDPLQMLMQNPALLIGGLALIYLITQKR